MSLVVLALTQVSTMVILPSEKTGDVRPLLDAYVANRESIVSGHGEFVRTTQALSVGIPEALRADVESGVRSRLLLFFDRQHCRVDELFDPDLTRSTKQVRQRGQYEYSYASSHLLTNGRVMLQVSIPVFERQVSQAVLRHGTHQFTLFHAVVPLAIGLPRTTRLVDSLDFESSVLAALNSESGLTGVTVDLLPEKVATYEVRVMKGTGIWRRFVVDLERGGVPLEASEYSDGRMVWQQNNDDLRIVDNRAWLPFHVRFVLSMTGGSHESLVRDLQVVSFQLKRPHADDLRVPLPPGCKFGDETTARAFTVSASTRFGFDEYFQEVPTVAGSVGRFSTSDVVSLDRDAAMQKKWPVWKVVALTACAVVFGLAVAQSVKRLKKQ